MKAILLAMTAIAMIQASAQDVPTAKYQQFYLTQSGERIEAAQAIIQALKGDTVFKCQTVEAKVSKSGTSIGIHNVKHAKRGGK